MSCFFLRVLSHETQLTGVGIGAGTHYLTSCELMWCYACSWDERRFTLNSAVQIHTSVTLLRHVISRGALVGSRANTPHTFLSSHTFREAWPTCRVLLSVLGLWLCLSCEGMRHVLSSGYEHIALWLRVNSLCSFRHTDSSLCLFRIEAVKLAKAGFEDSSLRTLV